MANKMAKASEEESWVVPPEYYVPLMDTFMAFSEAWTKAAPNVDKNSYTKLVEFKSLLSQIESMLIDDFGANVEEIAEAMVDKALAAEESKWSFEYVDKIRGALYYHVKKGNKSLGIIWVNLASDKVGVEEGAYTEEVKSPEFLEELAKFLEIEEGSLTFF